MEALQRNIAAPAEAPPNPAPAPIRGRLKVRQMRPTDIPAVRELQRTAYPAMRPWSPEQIAAQLERFPEGQLVAELDGRVVGAASALIVKWADHALEHTWKSVTAAGTFDTHDPSGRTLYGAEVMVAPGRRGNGIGRALYRARADLCRRLNLRRTIACGRLPGYHNFRDAMTPEHYAMHVVWGDIDDPVLRFQLANGFHYCGIVHDYLPADAESCGHAALIVRLNRRYKPQRPAATPLREAA